MFGDSLVLGFVQGLTEFLPVSSSAHLVIMQRILGWREPALAFDLMLHVATMMATLIFFRNDVGRLGMEWLAGFRGGEGRRPGWRYGGGVSAATMATALVGLPLKPMVERALSSTMVVGLGLILTAALLEGAMRVPEGRRRLGLGQAFLVGVAQGVATFPGISRSGSTIAASVFLGIPREEAFRFSFLLSLPAIRGATLLEGRDLGGWKAFVMSLPSGWWAGMAVAFVTGLMALAVLRRLVVQGRWRGFAVYCALLGGSTVVFSLLFPGV